MDIFSHFIFRELRFVGLFTSPSHHKKRPCNLHFHSCLRTFVIVGSWLVILSDILIKLLLNPNTVVGSPVVDNSTKHTDDSGGSNLIEMIYELRIIFRRSSNALIFTYAAINRAEITEALIFSFKAFVSHFDAKDSGHHQLSPQLLLATLYAFYIWFVLWAGRIKSYTVYILSNGSPHIIFGNFPIETLNLISGTIMSISEFSNGALAGLAVIILGLPRVAMEEMTSTATELLECSKDSSCIAENEKRSRMLLLTRKLHSQHEHLISWIQYAENGFTALIGFILAAATISIFTALPAFFQKSLYVLVTEDWMDLLSFVGIPVIIYVVIMLRSASNYKKSHDLCLIMAESIGRMEIQELRSLSWTMSGAPRAVTSVYRGDRSLLVESLETLLCNIEKRPLAVEIGMLKFVDSRSFAGLLALIVGYLCFLVERNEGVNETSNIRQYATVLIAKINATVVASANSSHGQGISLS